MLKNQAKPLVTILGPTASGKTSLSIALAKEIKGEIISADSRQVYRSMDIGTGKDISDYKEVPYHLIDILNAGEQYNVAAFQDDFQRVLKKIHSRGNSPILCGGSGLYIQSVLQDFKFTYIPRNNALRETLTTLNLEELRTIFNNLTIDYPFPTSPSTKRHFIRAIETLKWQELNTFHGEKSTNQFSKINSNLIFGLNPKAEIRRERISNRLKERLNEGLLEEIETLLSSGITPEKLIHYVLEYKWGTLYLKGEINYSDFYKKLETSIHQFAKRQMTYFRKMEKDGLKIEWLNWGDPLDKQINFIKDKLNLISSRF
jgi:tRNA dimethylallyltransferase